MLYYIYKICCDEFLDYVYVGSTQAFRQRKAQHKQSCNNKECKKYNIKLYKTIRENGGWDNWRMVCIDEIDIENKRQAEIKEEEWRVKLNANLNSQKAYISEEEKKELKNVYNKEYYEIKKEQIKEQNLEYYNTHKEEKLKRNKEYREINKEQIAQQRKKYREINKGTILEKKREYYQQNRDKLTEKITCECGSIVSRQQMRKHVKTKKHEAWEWRQNMEL